MKYLVFTFIVLPLLTACVVVQDEYYYAPPPPPPPQVQVIPIQPYRVYRPIPQGRVYHGHPDGRANPVIVNPRAPQYQRGPQRQPNIHGHGQAVPVPPTNVHGHASTSANVHTHGQAQSNVHGHGESANVARVPPPVVRSGDVQTPVHGHQ